METLPVEVIPNIAQYLQVKDLASCCAVSPWWRDVFGSDEVWKPRCDAESEEYLRTTPCQVEPKFITPQTDKSNLSPVGRWRTAYMREAHMWRNWISGNCVVDIIKDGYIDEYLLFLNNDFFVAVGHDFIELIDTAGNPSFCIGKLGNPSGYHSAELVRSGMFINCFNENVHVIELDLQSRTLSVKRTIKVSEDRWHDEYVVVGSVFVGTDQNNCVQIWNLENGSKIKTEKYCFPHEGFFSDIYCYKNCQDLIVAAHGKNDVIHCFVYNLKELTFFSFTTQISATGFFDYQMAIVKPYVALSYGANVKVYNYENSKLVQDCPTLPWSKIWVLAHRGNFIFINDKQDLVHLTPSTGAIRHLYSGTFDFRCLSEKLVAVYTVDDEYVLCKVGPTSTVKTLLVQVSEVFSNTRLVVINQAHSKLVKVEKTRMVCIHFW